MFDITSVDKYNIYLLMWKNFDTSVSAPEKIKFKLMHVLLAVFFFLVKIFFSFRFVLLGMLKLKHRVSKIRDGIFLLLCDLPEVPLYFEIKIDMNVWLKRQISFTN